MGWGWGFPSTAWSLFVAVVLLPTSRALTHWHWQRTWPTSQFPSSLASAMNVTRAYLTWWPTLVLKRLQLPQLSSLIILREIDFAADAGLDYWAILEFDEGGWLCPTRGADGKPDTMRIEALKAALAE